jgi:molybdopterin-guanine dinucleotide biosynthesis protein A
MIVTSERQPWSAIVLAGGTAQRLGGIDKASLEVSGRTLLDHLIGTLPDTVPIVVAGPRRPTVRPVTYRVEDPAGSGPVAAIAAALAAISTPHVAVVAVDIPWSGPVVLRLMDELSDAGDAGDAEAIIPIDAQGRRQLLCSAWRTTALAAALDRLGDPGGRSVRALVDGVVVRERPLSEDEAVMLADIDTPDDLARERQRVGRPTLDHRPRGG